MSSGWPAKGLSHDYGSEDHLTRANFEADVHVFGHDKTVAQTIQLNQLLKDSKDFKGFKTEAAKVLTNLNERNLKTEYNTAKATAVSTANVLRAVADGAKYMQHRATMDTHTRPVHAALNGKVWRIDDPNDTEWRKWAVPLGYGCRCHDLFIDEADAGDLITNADAERLVGDEETVRLTRDGFLQDRVDKKALFTSRQSYLAGLPNPDQTAYKIDSLSYQEQGQQPWKEISKAQLSPYKLPDKSRQDALDAFKEAADDDVQGYTDHRGAPIFLTRTALLTQLTPAHVAEDRPAHYFTVADTLAQPDEVYFTTGKVLTNTYLKFHADNTVLAAVVEYSKDLPQSLKSWYQVPADKIDAARQGLLIHTK